MPRAVRARRKAPASIVDDDLRLSSYVTLTPTVPQAAFMLLNGPEAFYGGSAGPGKSVALWLSGAQYLDVKGYAALILRRELTDLDQPGGIMERSHEWLHGSGAVWSAQKHRWTTPEGGIMQFGHAESEQDIYRYAGGEYQYIGVDEASEFTEKMLRFLFSRQRRRTTIPVPLRMRYASNPGGPGAEYLRARFVDARDPLRPFIRARLADNPHIDREQYVASLDHLDPITRLQLLNGDWSARQEGSIFRREWFKVVEVAPPLARAVRYWDLAATRPKRGRDPDYTAGVLMGRTAGGRFVILDVVRRRETPERVLDLMESTARADKARLGTGVAYRIAWEEEGGAGGKFASEAITKRLAGFSLHADHKTSGESKFSRAQPLSSQAEAGNLDIVAGIWLPQFLDEVEGFGTPGVHDDEVDGASGAFAELTRFPGAGIMEWMKAEAAKMATEATTHA